LKSKPKKCTSLNSKKMPKGSSRKMNGRKTQIKMTCATGRIMTVLKKIIFMISPGVQKVTTITTTPIIALKTKTGSVMRTVSGVRRETVERSPLQLPECLHSYVVCAAVELVWAALEFLCTTFTRPARKLRRRIKRSTWQLIV
jgi:hypothetical protein